MQTQTPAPSTSTEHFAGLMQMLTGYWVSQAIYSAVKLGLPELLQTSPQTASQIAVKIGADEYFLYRLMRALAALGILMEEGGQLFRLSAMGEMLCENAPNSMRAIALMLGEEHYQAWGGLSDGVASGKTPFENVYQAQCFEYFEKNQRVGDIFNQAMTAFVKNEVSVVSAAYDFSQFERLADIGGGHGRLLASILKRNPNLSGVVFDLPHVVEGAKVHFQEAGVADRAELQGGDFFEAVPQADGYILSHIIHDWSDELSIKILKNIHAAMRPGGKLLLAETVIVPGSKAVMGTLMDLNMLVMTPGGRERTEAEYQKLLASAGFQLLRVVPVTPMVSIVEAIKQS